MKIIKLVLGILISIFFLYQVLQGIDLTRLGDVLGQVNYLLLIPALFVHFSTFYFRAIRWGVILKPLKKIATGPLFSVLSISYMANNLLPFRAGEVIRAVMMGKKEGISRTGVMSTVILERVLDGLTLLLFLSVISAFHGINPWLTRVGLVSTGIFLGAFIFLAALIRWQEVFCSLLSRLEFIFPKGIGRRLTSLIAKFTGGVLVIKQVRGLAKVLVLSLLIWFMEALVYNLLSLGFGFNSPFIAGFFIVVIVSLGIMIPASPGYIGTFEYFVTKSLGIFGVPATEALGYAFILRLIQYLPVTIVGLIYFIREQVDVRNTKGILTKSA